MNNSPIKDYIGENDEDEDAFRFKRLSEKNKPNSTQYSRKEEGEEEEGETEFEKQLERTNSNEVRSRALEKKRSTSRSPPRGRIDARKRHRQSSTSRSRSRSRSRSKRDRSFYSKPPFSESSRSSGSIGGRNERDSENRNGYSTIHNHTFSKYRYDPSRSGSGALKSNKVDTNRNNEFRGGRRGGLLPSYARQPLGRGRETSRRDTYRGEPFKKDDMNRDTYKPRFSEKTENDETTSDTRKNRFRDRETTHRSLEDDTTKEEVRFNHVHPSRQALIPKNIPLAWENGGSKSDGFNKSGQDSEENKKPIALISKMNNRIGDSMDIKHMSSLVSNMLGPWNETPKDTSSKEFSSRVSIEKKK